MYLPYALSFQAIDLVLVLSLMYHVQIELLYLQPLPIFMNNIKIIKELIGYLYDKFNIKTDLKLKCTILNIYFVCLL